MSPAIDPPVTSLVTVVPSLRSAADPEGGVEATSIVYVFAPITRGRPFPNDTSTPPSAR